MDLINSYAIVAYVAGPIARFADRLRADLVPGTPYHAHITILPPRSLCCSPSEAMEFTRQLVAQFEPFEVRIGKVEVFESTKVMYLSLASGICELQAMHDLLNTGCMEQQEMYEYVPHLTLGQELPPECFDGCLETCRRRLEELGSSGLVRIETLTFVRQRVDGQWENLAELALGQVGARI